MANYRSLVGGFFSKNPNDISIKRTIRTNNPWALNWSAWQETYPGFVGQTAPDASPNANKSTIYETPEQGIAAGYNLLTKYAAGGHDTVGEIINRYGGDQDYSGYLADVTKRTGFTASTKIDLRNDTQLLTLAKAMMRHEAGQDIPWSDAQILYGFKLAREYAGGPKAPVPVTVSAKIETRSDTTGGFFAALARLIAALFGQAPKQVTIESVRSSRILKKGDKSPKGGDVWQLQEKLREIGFVDIVVDGEFGAVMEQAVRTFQDRENLDPDGQVGELTLAALNRAKGPTVAKPPLLPPPASTGGVPNIKPDWYARAEKDIGFREVGNNRGIERFIVSAKTGSLGDPWCAIFVNAKLEDAAVGGSRSAMARSFERHANFIKLKEPALGAIVTMWRGSPSSGSGHVFLYDGESAKGVRGIGGNEDNAIKRSFHDRGRITGYWWPKNVPLPTTGKIAVSDSSSVVTRSEV